ncbi:MAG TPA: hypothetical protein PLC42_04330, partial [Parachlamydiaceae bacterium]|nr:hypothetical protein [Parachlamydiaceae bacterium]
MATLEEKAEKLEHALKGNYSKKELDNYFQTSELDRNFKIAEPVKKTLWKLADSQVKNYAQNNIFHLSDSLELIDSKLNDLLKFFSPGQRTALFQGIAEMTDQEQSFRQLFSSLHNTYSQNAPQLLESFPRDHFIHYFVNNLKNIQKENLPSGGSFFTLNRIIVHGRLNPVVELLVLHAIEKNDYASINKILSYMQFHFDLKNPIDCKYLTEDQIATFKNNSTLDMQFKKMKNIDDYMQ